LRELVSACRNLEAEYHAELRRLTGNAEAAARSRHLRFHLLADAEIQKIGAGRKQILASHNIVTAADINEAAIRRIKGFGDALTANLMAWKAEVLRAFRFDPTPAVSTGEQRALTLQFRARQQQILAELDQRLRNLMSLAPQCQASIQKLIPELRDAVAAWEQADADLRLLQRRR
jgi:DNA-binding helix-hairpin-helix protein with protein kinase domain